MDSRVKYGSDVLLASGINVISANANAIVLTAESIPRNDAYLSDVFINDKHNNHNNNDHSCQLLLISDLAI